MWKENWIGSIHNIIVSSQVLVWWRNQKTKEKTKTQKSPYTRSVSKRSNTALCGNQGSSQPEAPRSHIVSRTGSQNWGCLEASNDAPCSLERWNKRKQSVFTRALNLAGDYLPPICVDWLPGSGLMLVRMTTLTSPWSMCRSMHCTAKAIYIVTAVAQESHPVCTTTAIRAVAPAADEEVTLGLPPAKVVWKPCCNKWLWLPRACLEGSLDNQ